MKKTLIVALMTVAGIASAQEMCSHSEKFGATLKVINPICFTNEDCQKEIAEIKRCLPDDYVSDVDPQSTAKKAIAKLNKQIANNNASAKEAKRLASLPGVRIGMTTEQVLKESNWGKPRRINRTTTASGTREQWVYGYPNYLYFTNGVLTSIQN